MTGEKHTVYTCCPEAGCGTHRAIQDFLLRWGLKPALGHDDFGHYIEFWVPRAWSARRRREFVRAFSRGGPVPARPSNSPGLPSATRQADAGAFGPGFWNVGGPVPTDGHVRGT